jgi:hypothetical protein
MSTTYPVLGGTKSKPADKFTLADLNGLSEGLGDEIYRLMEHPGSFPHFLETKEKVERLLGEQGLKTKDVYVERGLAEGLTIDAAFDACPGNYQFRNQCDM